jgi:very-short-patch-repair endonuclease
MKNVDTRRWADRIMASSVEAETESLEYGIWFLLDRGICESPIEAALALAIQTYDRLYLGVPSRLLIATLETVSHYPADQRLLIAQFKFQNYRIDWVWREAPFQIFIECDGHDFHERTKEQAARDRQKDRAIQQAGIPIFRFTGSEIYADPIGCASQLLDVVSELHCPRTKAAG